MLCCTNLPLRNQGTYLPNCWELPLLTVHSSQPSLSLGNTLIQKMLPCQGYAPSLTQIFIQSLTKATAIYWASYFGILLSSPLWPTSPVLQQYRPPSVLASREESSVMMRCPSYRNLPDGFGEWTVFWGLLQEYSWLVDFLTLRGIFTLAYPLLCTFSIIYHGNSRVSSLVCWHSMPCNHLRPRNPLYGKRWEVVGLWQRDPLIPLRSTDPIRPLYPSETAGLTIQLKSLLRKYLRYHLGDDILHGSTIQDSSIPSISDHYGAVFPTLGNHGPREQGIEAKVAPHIIIPRDLFGFCGATGPASTRGFRVPLNFKLHLLPSLWGFLCQKTNRQGKESLSWQG